VLFALVHFAPLQGTAQTFAVGLVLGGVLIAARGNLAAPVLAHATYNAASLAAIAAAATSAAAEAGG
jgi:membrane protease YdiL (CAAX protease family)